jgi:hypothetical protein
MFNEDKNDLSWIGVMLSLTYMYVLYAIHFELLKIAIYNAPGWHMETHIRFEMIIMQGFQMDIHTMANLFMT